MKASIVIRTFNSELTIRRVLEGVQIQLFRDYELVIVDSGSKDTTTDIINEYPHTFVDNSEAGYNHGAALNAGCKVAQGEYIVCLSHHCVPLHREWLGMLVSALDKDRNLAGASGRLVFDVGDYLVGETGIEHIGLEKFYRRPNHGLQNPNSIIRRELWQEHPFSEKLEACEDQEWAHYFMQLGYETALVREARVLYDTQSTLYRHTKNSFRNLLVLNDLFGYRPKGSTSELYRSSTQLLKQTALGTSSARVSGLSIAGMVAEWAATNSVGCREIFGRGRSGLRVEKAKLEEVRSKEVEGGPQATVGTPELAKSLTTHPEVDSSAELRPGTRFFVVGEMRSGTSWLSRTLNTHPEIFCKGEGSFFGRDQGTEEIPVYSGSTPSLHNAIANCEGLRTWHSLSWNAWGQRSVDRDLLNLTRLATDYFMLEDAAASGKRIVGDKSPLHTDHVAEIAELYPEARVIHIVRDGRDVAVSLMHHFWRLARDRGGIFELEPEELEKRDAYIADPAGFLESGHSIFIESRLAEIATRWSRRVSAASLEGTNRFGPSYHQLRYEDLLARPEDNLRILFETLDARADDDVVSNCVQRNSFEKLAKRSKGDEDPNAFLRKGVAGDWRGVFTERDRAIYEGIAKDTLLSMGYALD